MSSTESAGCNRNGFGGEHEFSLCYVVFKMFMRLMRCQVHVGSMDVELIKEVWARDINLGMRSIKR